MDYSPPGSSVHGIFQARILEWVATSYSRGSSQPRDRTRVSCIGRRILTSEHLGSHQTCLIKVNFYSDHFHAWSQPWQLGQRCSAHQVWHSYFRDNCLDDKWVMMFCTLPFYRSGLQVPGVPRPGEEGPHLAFCKTNSTHTHTHVNCHCHVLGQLPENKTKSPPGSPHPVLFENKHVIVYDVNYSSIGNELRVSNSFRMGHFIAEGSLGLWVLAKNHVSSSDRRQRELGLKANFSASGLCWEVERTQEPWGFNLPNLRQILLSPSILGPSAVKQGNGT